MLGRFAKTWMIGDAIKIDLQRGMDLPARCGVTCPGTNEIDSLTAYPVDRHLGAVRRRPQTYTPVLPFRGKRDLPTRTVQTPLCRNESFSRSIAEERWIPTFDLPSVFCGLGIGALFLVLLIILG